MLNREVQEFEKRYIFWGSYISILEGKILTQLEASIIDGKQLEALKSVFREMIWKWAEETSYCDNCRNGNGKRNLPRLLRVCLPKSGSDFSGNDTLDE